MNVETVKVECVICGEVSEFSAEEWRKYSEEHFSDTDRGDAGFIGPECEDWQPGPDEEN